MSMRNIKLILSYDGTNYSGFQRQKNAFTIQELLENALGRILQEEIKVIPSGRTDAGVHARGQVVNFRTTSTISTERLPYAVNSCLPSDIVVLETSEVPLTFHAGHDALSKCYRYTIDCGKFADPFWRYFSWHPPHKLDQKLLVEAGGYFVGVHDFTSFRAAGSAVKTSVRNIINLEWDFSNERLWHLFIEGNGFLYNMVRIIVGTLAEVGRGKIMPGKVQEILLAKNRKLAGPTAPAKGLFLWEVKY